MKLLCFLLGIFLPIYTMKTDEEIDYDSLEKETKRQTTFQKYFDKGKQELSLEENEPPSDNDEPHGYRYLMRKADKLMAKINKEIETIDPKKKADLDNLQRLEQRLVNLYAEMNEYEFA